MATSPKCDRHQRHVGVCATCQRVQLARWRAQLIDAEAARQSAGRGLSRVSGPPPVRIAASMG